MQETTSYRVLVDLLVLLGDPLPQADGHEVDDRAPTWVEAAADPLPRLSGISRNR